MTAPVEIGEADQRRFDRYCAPKHPRTGCREWTGPRAGKGYGIMSLNGDRMYAHRLAYLMVCGFIPAGKFVCHRCDNPLCVTPSHLFLGDAADNNADMVRKGRIATKENGKWTPRRNGRQKLTATDVADIRASYVRLNHNQSNARALSRRFGVHKATITSIIRGRYLPDDTPPVDCPTYLANPQP